MSVDVCDIKLSKKPKLTEYTATIDWLAYSILSIDVVLYFSFTIAAIIIEALSLKIVFSLLAGFMIGQLFIIGHDAAHKTYVSNKEMNVLIARLVFLPVLHNYTIWLYVHNHLHHAHPNIKGYNSWSPKSLQEYQSLPKWRKIIEKIYRSPLGLGPYYIVERWLKVKLFPRKLIPKRYHVAAWKDFIMLTSYLFIFMLSIVLLAKISAQSAISSLLWGALLPFFFWNYLAGLTVYQQHTHETVKWYSSKSEWKKDVESQAEVSIYIQYPHWYNFITHNVYYHPVHHINTRIPIYKLPQAQDELEKAMPELIMKIPFSFLEFYKTLSNCKLYDYANHKWLDFNGEETT